MAFQTIFILLVLFISFPNTNQTLTNDHQTHFFDLMLSSFSGIISSKWDFKATHVCNFTGVSCNKKGLVVNIDVSDWSITGHLPENICTYLPELRILRLGNNKLGSEFPKSITNCTHLQELNMTSAFLTHTIPNISQMSSLKILDLSYNYFSGKFPVSFTNLTNLEVLNFNENEGFDLWKLPEDFSTLTKLKSMVLTTCMIYGNIPESISNMTSLIDLELSGNFLVGSIPVQFGSLKNLQKLELYYNQLTGPIPHSLGNLTALTELDMSVNILTASLPPSICNLPNLEVLYLYNNSLTGEIPNSISSSKTLAMLSLYDNSFTGQVPRNLGLSSPMIVLDLSENQLSGELPQHVCKAGKLVYFLLLDNKFTGILPESYSNCESLNRFRVSHNFLEGLIPSGILGLPHVSIIDLGYNRFSGSISRSLGNAKNLSEFFVQSNFISGDLPVEISQLTNLVKLDLSNNRISGPIPNEIGNLKRLSLLELQGNEFDSLVPDSLSLLKSLNVLDLSRNRLTGNIPENLPDLLPSSMNFSDNKLTGSIPVSFIKEGLLECFLGNPDLCVPIYSASSSYQNFPICPKNYTPKRTKNIWLIGISVVILIIGILLFFKHRFSKMESSSLFFLYDIKIFHQISINQREVIESMVDKNIVGHGGSGTVYKIKLNNGEFVAVKKLWSRKMKDYDHEQEDLVLDKELRTEVETLGSIRHINIVKLYCYMSSLDTKLLVYEYMPNGNLWDAIHREENLCLDWKTRYEIALGVARGLVYLHHDLLMPIVHRDIKTTNILLDVDYKPKVADFGIAKVLKEKGAKDSSYSVVSGTYGYLAPEYAYSSKATTKCDVYSFGVVLLELITGKKPVETEYGENNNIVSWVLKKVETEDGVLQILDDRLYVSVKDDITKILGIAIRCTCVDPALRPAMDDVVQMLVKARPQMFDSSKSKENRQ